MDKSFLFPSSYIEKKKNLSCYRNTGLVGSQELERARRISGGFQLPSQRTHPSPVLSSSISLPSVLITVLLGNCIPEGPAVPSVLSEVLPRAAPLVT